MRNRGFASLLFVVMGCATAGNDPFPGGEDPLVPVDSSSLEITPRSVVAKIVDGRVVNVELRVTSIAADGTATDVTDLVAWSLADTRFGKFHDNRLTVMGGGAGPTDVIARLPDGRSTTAPLTVYVTGTRNLGLPDAAQRLFDGAAPTTGCEPSLAYPENHTLVPANLGTFDVHWTDTMNDMFAVRVRNRFVDLTYFTNQGWMAVESDWSLFATSRATMMVEVEGMRSSAPTHKCTSDPRYVEVTREDARGAVYYWSTDWAQRAQGGSGQDIIRYDFAKPAIAPAPMFTDATRPAACVGCHALSRDGKKLALTLDGSGGQGAVLDLATNRQMMPTGGDAPRWSSAAFNHDGEKLVAVEAGQMRLLDANSGAVLATIPNFPGMIAGNPEISPDGRMLVNVESSGTEDWTFGDASIVVRDFDNATNTFGKPRVLMPFDEVAGTQTYYPSWSPDSQWIAVTRAPAGTSYANPEATIWILRADGRHAPIELPATKGAMSSWARWLPAENHVGDEPVYFLSFSSARPFGTRIPEGGMPQIWIAPFYPERANKFVPMTGPAFHAPFQNLYASNHNAQWTEAVVTAP